MDQILNILSDIRVLAAIAVVILFLVGWLVFMRLKTKGYRKELKEYEEAYQQIKNNPLQHKMTKSQSLAKIDADTTQKVQEAKTVFDSYEENSGKVSSLLGDAEDLIYMGKLKKADGVLNQVDELIAVCKSQASTLNDMLDLILAKETTQRQQVTVYKNRFRALKSQAQEHYNDLSYCWDFLETKIASCEKMFSTFEEWMFSSDFEKANQELSNIQTTLDEIEKDIEAMPSLLQDARGVIPSLAEDLHKTFVNQRNRGVYLNHIEIEKNLSALTVALKNDLKNVKNGNLEGVKDNLESYRKRIEQMKVAVNEEGKAFDQIEDLKQSTLEEFDAVEKSLTYVKENFNKTSVRFGLEGMEGDLHKRDEEFKRLLAEKPRVMDNVSNRMLPATTTLVSLKELNEHILEVGESLKKMRSKIEVASGDEDRARRQLVKLQIIMSQIQVKIRKYKLPNISSKYESDMAAAQQHIDGLSHLMHQKLLNIQVINAKMQEALDFIYRLYNDVNNVVGTVVMIENTIVFGNRYRSTYADIDSELTRSELAFRNGEYTQALTMAISTIEKIHPGNYEHMIKENAKGAEN